MRFSDEFGIHCTDLDDWFDPVLTVDTKLFIDPFLLYAHEQSFFIGSHTEIINFFNEVFAIIARTGGDPSHLFWKRAEALLIFPEAQELCLGYATGSTKGSGSGTGFSYVIASALWQAVQAGIKHFSHFEEVGILREGIGADRISDITANLLRHQFASYSLEVFHRHKVPTKLFRYNRGSYNPVLQRWMPTIYELAENPYNHIPILLCPARYLRDLPTISADNFWDYCYQNENETLRNDYSADITRNVDKKTIIDFAQRHPEFRDEYIAYLETKGAAPYDYKKDRKGLVSWYDATADYCRRVPINLAFQTEDEFKSVIQVMLDEFSNYIENNGGWSLLWNDNKTAKSEEAAQFLFLGIVKHYCRANNIDISREVNIGRGPVDFKMSQGQQFRALLELKLAKNTKFWNGLTRQLPKYQEAEGVSMGYFIVIAYADADLQRIKNIQERVSEVNDSTGYQISTLIIDAQRNPPSASKL